MKKKSVDRSEILRRLAAAKSDRGPVTIYVSKSLFKRFQKACADHAASQVLEELMREFLSES